MNWFFFFAAFKIHKVCFFSNFINIYLSMHLCIYATWSSLRFLNTHTHTPFGKLNGIISSNVLSVSAVTSFSLGLLFYICWYIWWCHMFSLISGFFLKHHYWLFLFFISEWIISFSLQSLLISAKNICWTLPVYFLVQLLHFIFNIFVWNLV